MVYVVAYQFMNRTAEDVKPFYDTLERFPSLMQVTETVCLVATNATVDSVHDSLETCMRVGDTLFVARLWPGYDFETYSNKVKAWMEDCRKGGYF